MSNKNEFILENYNRDMLINTLSDFLYKVCYSSAAVDEAMRKMKELIPQDFNPIRYFAFNPIYAFEKFTHGSNEEHIYCTPLFKRCGCLLSVVPIGEWKANTKAMKCYEIFLLDNLEIVVVPGYITDIEIDGTVTSCKYLYRENLSIYNLKGRIDSEKFVYDVAEEVLTAYQCRGCRELYEECSECPLHEFCESHANQLY